MRERQKGDVTVPIPFDYVWMTASIKDRNKRKEKFREYVKGYIEKSYPELKYDTTKGMQAICKWR